MKGEFGKKGEGKEESGMENDQGTLLIYPRCR